MKCLITFFILFSMPLLYAQVALRGMVVDYDNADLVVGATISIEGTSFTGDTDLDGKYEISDIPPGDYKVIVTAKNYQKKYLSKVKVDEFDVRLDITIELMPPVLVSNNPKDSTKTTRTDTVEVVEVGKIEENGSVIVILKQKKSTQIIDNVNSDIIGLSGARHTGEVIAQMPSVTVLENKYAIIRGLSDRYNTFRLNGTTLPNTEIERKGFDFALIPASMIDEVVIYKSASADMGAEMAGGSIQINTIDFPNKRKFSATLGLNFNDLATGKPFLGSEGNQLGTVQTLSSSFPTTYKIARSQGLYSSYTPIQSDYNFLANTAKTLPNTWEANTQNAPIGQHVAFVYQNKFKLGRHKLGLSAAAEMNNTFNVNYIERTDFLGIKNSNSVLDFTYQNKQYVRKNAVNGFFNLAYELNPNNKIVFKNFVGVVAESQVDVLTNGYQSASYDANNNITDSAYKYKANFLRLVPRAFWSAQLMGEHLFPNVSIKGLKIDWRAGYTYFLRNEPDYRRSSYRLNNADGQYYLRIPRNSGNGYNDYAGFGASRVYIVGEDEVYSGELNASLPFVLLNAQSRIKTGGFVESKYRFFDARSLGYALGANNPHSGTWNALTQDPSVLFGGNYFSDTNIVLVEGTRNADNYIANSLLFGGYGMFETTIKKHWKTSAGLRLESFKQTLEVQNNLRLANHDTLPVNTLVVDLLPSLNLIYNPNERLNLRVSGSKTLSRPDPRELSNFSFLNASYTVFYAGNNNLSRTEIYNGDIRAEYFDTKNNVVSIGVFYKYFINPIEQTILDYTVSTLYYRTYQLKNTDQAQSTGIEASYKGNLAFLGTAFAPMQVFANASYIHSQVSVEGRTRPLQGQSPYVCNTGLNYNFKKAKVTLTASYQRFGKRIAIVGKVNSTLNYPDIYELGRDIVDISVSKRLGKHFDIRLDLRDLLNQPIRLVQIADGKTYQENRDPLILRQQRGFNSFFTAKYEF